MDTLGEIMHNRYQIEYRLGNAPIILMGRLSLGPPERGVAEKSVSDKERVKGWGWGWATASVEEGRGRGGEVYGGNNRAEMVG